MTAIKAQTIGGISRALAEAAKACNEIVSAGLVAIIEVHDGNRKRTLDQSAVVYAWYSEVAKFLGDRTALDVRKESKLVLGIPILRTEDAEYRDRYDRLIRQRFTFEEKLEIMADWPVTSMMSTVQLGQYMTAMQDYWLKRGIRLVVKEKQQKRKAA